MLAWFAPLLVLGLVVFVHEFGHFLAAKIMGVYAPRFSLGWGPAVLRWRPKGTETEYVLSALPIGGYVRMASRDDETSSVLEGGNEAVKEGAEHDKDWDPEAMVPHGPKPVPANRWFESKPAWARIFILLSGVTMNALLTITVATGIFAVNGRTYLPAVIDSTIPGMPAAGAGFQHGDSVVAVNGVALRSWTEFASHIAASPKTPMHVTLTRSGAPLTIDVTPVDSTVPNPMTGAPQHIGLIGAWPHGTLAHDPMSLGASLSSGWRATLSMGGSVIGVLGGLVHGTISVKMLGGPIQIARTSVEAAKSGSEALFTLIAFLSINLAVLNLLPIPILDGGQVLLVVAEAVKGSRFSDRVRDVFMKVGLAAIALLFAVVMYNDLKGLIFGR